MQCEECGLVFEAGTAVHQAGGRRLCETHATAAQRCSQCGETVAGKLVGVTNLACPTLPLHYCCPA